MAAVSLARIQIIPIPLSLSLSLSRLDSRGLRTEKDLTQCVETKLPGAGGRLGDRRIVIAYFWAS